MSLATGHSGGETALAPVPRAARLGLVGGDGRDVGAGAGDVPGLDDLHATLALRAGVPGPGGRAVVGLAPDDEWDEAPEGRTSPLVHVHRMPARGAVLGELERPLPAEIA